MPRTRKPRAGSLQFWPRKRSKYSYPRIRNWSRAVQPKPLGFAGYKIGMTHILVNDVRPNSLTKGLNVFFPVTLVECPPLKSIGINFYKITSNGANLSGQLLGDVQWNFLSRKLTTPKNKGKVPELFNFIRLLCCTQPNLTSTGQKKPQIFEIGLGGDKDQQLAYTLDKLGKEISISEVFKEGQFIDIHGITKGKGFQGPVKRFGVQLRHHKSEKSRRNPGSLGAWNAQGHIMWRTAHAGKMGHHLRTEYNKRIAKIVNFEDIKQKGGFIRYGDPKNTCILVEGSLAGPKNGLVRFTETARLKNKHNFETQISYLSTESKQK